LRIKAGNITQKSTINTCALQGLFRNHLIIRYIFCTFAQNIVFGIKKRGKNDKETLDNVFCDVGLAVNSQVVYL